MQRIDRRKLERLILENGYSMEAFKNEVPVSGRTIERLMTDGHVVRNVTILRICEFLGCKPVDVLMEQLAKKSLPKDDDGALQFIVGSPVDTPPQFHAREAELFLLQRMLSRVPLQCALIHGERGTGKTSLLYRLTKTLKTRLTNMHEINSELSNSNHTIGVSVPTTKVHTIPFRNVVHTGRKGLFEALAKILTEEPASADVRSISRAAAALRGNRIVVALDDIDALVGEEHDIDDDVWNFLRHLPQVSEGYLSYLVTARSTDAVLCQRLRSDSPFFNIFAAAIPLKPFTQQECEQFVTDMRPEWPNSDVDWLVKRSEGNPAALQMLCQQKSVSEQLGRQAEWKHAAKSWLQLFHS